MRFASTVSWLGILVLSACSSLSNQAIAVESATPVTVHHPVVFEAPYKLGQRPTLRSKTEAKKEEEAISRWNTGGRDGTWHPHPRVIVDGIRVNGQITSTAVLRTARAHGYWPIRRCYDPALVTKHDLRGKVSIRFTLRNSGTAVQPTFIGKPTLEDTNVANCIRQSIRSIKFPRTRRGDAQIDIDVTVHPGDAPMKAVEKPPVEPGPGTIDLPTVQALIARHAGARIQQCYVDAMGRVPGLWGRMVLRADVAPNGGIRDLIEVDSTFPDGATTRCAIDAIKQIGLPPPENGDLRVVIPIKFGRPPS